MTNIENWKPVKDYNGLYEVSDFGQIKNIKRNKILEPKIDKNGYCVYNLCKNGIVKTRKGHRLVCQSFIDNPFNKNQVNHKDGIKCNNRLENLEWATQRENSIHASNILGIKGISGIDNWRSKAIKCSTLDIEFGSIREAERALGVWMSGIRKVLSGKWKHANGFVFRYLI